MGIFLKVYPQDELLPQGRSPDPAVDVFAHPTQRSERWACARTWTWTALALAERIAAASPAAVRGTVSLLRQVRLCPHARTLLATLRL